MTMPTMTRSELNSLSTLALAHVGDAVYELLVRSHLASHGLAKVTDLHRAAVAMVKAPAQAKAAAKLLPLLTEEERGVYRRGRNSHVGSVPQAATKAEYHAATGLEAVFGWLYLAGERERIAELFAAALDEGCGGSDK